MGIKNYIYITIKVKERAKIVKVGYKIIAELLYINNIKYIFLIGFHQNFA